MATAPTIENDTPQFSSNDSHIHLNVEGKARRERLNLKLKAGETDEIDAAGPQHLCVQCNAAHMKEFGIPVPAPARPSNKTYDRSLEIAEANENIRLKQEVADLKEYVEAQRAKERQKSPNKPAA
jgi:hypothetical protein